MLTVEGPLVPGSHTVVEAEELRRQTLCVWMSFRRTWPGGLEALYIL